MKTTLSILSFSGLALAAGSAANVWTVGIDNNAQFHVPGGVNAGTGGGVMANWVQEIDGSTPLPGIPDNAGGPASGAGRSVDDDYYFAGVYSTARDGGTYVPVGVVAANEENAERAFTGNDPDLRFHFNLPATISASDLLSVSFDFHTMDVNGLPQRDALLFWDVEVLMNGTSVGSFNVTDAMIRDDLNPENFELTTPAFTLGDVNGAVGSGQDNYVTLRGTNAGSSSRWMSLDYVQLDATAIPEPSPLGLALIAGVGAFLFARKRR